MEKELIGKKLLSGMDIKNVWIEYESIVVQDNEGNYYYFDPRNLIDLLNKTCFTVEKKKTRTWIVPI
jgi:hypothetical protein